MIENIKKKVLVTGGAGFLGSHVADALSDHGYEVTILDVKESPYLRNDQNMIICDILDFKKLKDIINNFDIVYHFAALSDLDVCLSNPIATIKYNILGTVNLLEICRDTDIKRFIFASTAYVFSDSGGFYRASKQASESYIELYHKLYDLNYTILRYGSLYGPRADEHNSIYKMLKQALYEGKITYHGTGDELREFVHVIDAARSSVEILKQHFENEALMITGIDSLKYKELLDMIKEMLNNKINIEIKPSVRKAHYKITPYNFNPKPGKKLTVNPHIDMGQGLLQCMTEIYNILNNGN